MRLCANEGGMGLPDGRVGMLVLVVNEVRLGDANTPDGGPVGRLLGVPPE